MTLRNRKKDSILRWFSAIALAGLLIWVLTSCGDSGTGTEPPPPTKQEFTVTANPLLDGSTYADATIYDNGSGEKLGEGQVAIDGDKGTSRTLRIEGPEVKTTTEAISFDRDKTVAIELERADPESVAISYEIRASGPDTLVAADVVNQATSETLAAAEASGTITLPFSDAATALCAAPQYFGEGCVEVTPDGDKSIVIRITRESVNVSASAEDTDGNTVENADIAVDGEIIGQGSISESFPARAGTRTISASAEDFSEDAETVSAGAAAEVTLQLERVFACNDGIDNDGDGVADADDSGCVDTFASTSHEPGTDGFVYEPEDDNEVLLRVQYSATLLSIVKQVSSAKGNRQQGVFGDTFPAHITLAVGQADIRLNNKIEQRQDGEAFALSIACGPENEPRDQHSNIITTDIVPDDQSVDGWRTSLVNGFTREILQNGTDCGFTAVHATEVRDEPFGDGNDDVFFSTEDETGGVSVVWFYEEEEVQ
jgi:hypothetical protein